jgi:arylsulfatase A-like enzyme
MKSSLLILFMQFFMLTSCYLTHGQEYNVLFVSIDDLRPQLGCYGDTIVKSPNLDSFAKGAMVFNRAYCQQALCSASRASIMTGLRPETTGLTGMHMKSVPLNQQYPGAYTLPQCFKDNGYFTYSIGKVFHQMGATSIGSDNISEIWTEPAWNPTHVGAYGPTGMTRYKEMYDSISVTGADMLKISSIPKVNYWEAPEIEDEELPDGAMADHAIEVIRQCKKLDKKFFLAVGFVKPHLPFVAPKKYWDLYQEDAISYAPNDFHPIGAPAYTLIDNIGIYKYNNGPQFNTRPTKRQELYALHGYLACISYVDAQFQKIIKELKLQNLYDNTIIVVYGDNGYQIGEHAVWGVKHSNYETSTRVPLLIRIPGNTDKGALTNGIVELLDLYPTLIDYCDLEMPLGYSPEGTSLKPLVSYPNQTWNKVAISVYPKTVPEIGRALGVAMVTDRYRIVKWEVEEKDYLEYELYDHLIDPQENFNLVNVRHYQEVLKVLKARLDDEFNIRN